jgi:hypothetical protein
MDGTELGEVLKAIGWSVAELQRRLGVRGDTVRQWLSNRREIPPNLERWLYQVRDAQGQAPALPDGWRSGGGC